MATVTILSADRRGDTVTVGGTVDGRPYVVQVWMSYLGTLPTRAAKVAYAAQQLKAAADADASAAVDLDATVTVP